MMSTWWGSSCGWAMRCSRSWSGRVAGRRDFRAAGLRVGRFFGVVAIAVPARFDAGRRAPAVFGVRTIGRVSVAHFERPPRVLVVEDDEAISQVLQRSLRMEGYDVRTAEDGTGALEQAGSFRPHRA